MINTSDEFYEKGWDLLSQDKVDEALRLVQKGLRQFTGDLDLQLLEAIALNALGHYALARKILELLRIEDPSHVGVLLELTIASLNLGKKKDALRFAREALHQSDADDADAVRLAQLFDTHHFSAQVARCSAIAVRKNAKNPEGWFLLGSAVWPDHIKAVEYCCMRALAARSDYWIAATMLGLICFDTKRFDEARVWWETIPITAHYDAESLVRWRSLLRSSDPKVTAIRHRWKELRQTEKPEPLHPWLVDRKS